MNEGLSCKQVFVLSVLGRVPLLVNRERRPAIIFINFLSVNPKRQTPVHKLSCFHVKILALHAPFNQKLHHVRSLGIHLFQKENKGHL